MDVYDVEIEWVSIAWFTGGGRCSSVGSLGLNSLFRSCDCATGGRHCIGVSERKWTIESTINMSDTRIYFLSYQSPANQRKGVIDTFEFWGIVELDIRIELSLIQF